jgi:fimbrial chaperone protein
VELVGTRVIYPESVKEKSLQFNSQDDYPNLVQVWLDQGNRRSKPETADAPFVATPQIFRVNPHSGQVVRLMFTGAKLLTDRESLFYLNFTQMPATKSSPAEANLLMSVVTSRVKVFYRPKGIKGRVEDLAKALKFIVQGTGAEAKILAENGTGYHALIRGATLLLGEKKIPLASSVMLAPISTTHWPMPDGVQPPYRLQLTLVNDLGLDVVTEVGLE